MLSLLAVGSQDELAVTQFFVHLPSEPLHVLLAKAEGLPQSQTLAVLQRSRDAVRTTRERYRTARLPSAETHLQYKRSTVTVVVLAPHVLQHSEHTQEV